MTHKKSTGLGGMTNLSVLAPIRNDMVVGFEPISFLERLRKVLDALQSSRQNVRESELRPPVFPDAIGRLGIIHHFRYALVPPLPGAKDQPADGVWHLSLNVTFDGGWEPYMRVIYREIGTLLDLLFCHSEGYPGSRSSSFEAYCDWVRSNEVDGGIFYTDSAATLSDQHYLAEVEKAQRKGSVSERDMARLAVPSAAVQMRDAVARAMSNPLSALVLPLRTLKGLYRLSTYFPGSSGAADDGDRVTLRRFAWAVLEGPIEVMKRLDSLPVTQPAGAAWAQAKTLFADELSWLRYAHANGVTKLAPAPCDPVLLQSHILAANEGMTHGCVVLLRVKDAALARTHIGVLAARCGPVPAGGIGHLVAFTPAGMKALGIASHHLGALPQEFVDGMEARCALLGDVRGNHPDHWTRPLAHGVNDNERRIDLKTVHLLVQMRLADTANTSFELHDTLRAAVDDLQAAHTGLRVLAVQATRSYRDAAGQTSGHFDFADDISQPWVPRVPSAAAADAPRADPIAPRDVVSAGELLLGHANERGDAPNQDIGPLLLDGSFLVLRKLRQRVDHLDSALLKVAPAQRAELLAKMMGRQRNGSPLAPLPTGATGPNDFNYETPAASDACPFHSHIRRANPRDGRSYTPRILRRGMSYGPKSDSDRSTERGVMFMAYCASIAEQFETIQRWVAGGNSAGVGSAQADPFLRVPQAGESSTLRYLDASGQVVRVAFDDEPLVQLEWGLYLFVPALAALQKLGSFLTERPPPAPTPTPPASESEEKERERLRQMLDDTARAPAQWKKVREGAASEVQDMAYGHLVGRFKKVLEVMKDPGTAYSVKGYGERMELSVGLNLLGLDPGPERTKQAPLNAAIEAVTEQEAFAQTLTVMADVFKQFPPLPTLKAGDAVRRPIDLVNFSDAVMAALCTKWIGLPQAPFMDPGGRLDDSADKPRCPGNFATASRYIFSPHPRKSHVEEPGQVQGKAVRKAVEAWLLTDPSLGTLATAIKKGLDPATTTGDLALSLAGVLLGFPPTVQGNFIRTMETWVKDEALWQHQQALYDEAPGATLSYEQANKALRAPLLSTMRKRPVPEMLWRSPVTNGVVDLGPKNRVVLGITSALTDEAAPDELMFGRDHKAAASPTVHGCPGYRMAMGVLLAMTAGLMKAGMLRPTGSPVLLILTPNKSAPPSPTAGATAPPAPGATPSASA